MTWQKQEQPLDEGFVAEAGANTMQQEREEDVYGFAVCGQLPLPRRGMERL